MVSKQFERTSLGLWLFRHNLLQLDKLTSWNTRLRGDSFIAEVFACPLHPCYPVVNTTWLQLDKLTSWNTRLRGDSFIAEVFACPLHPSYPIVRFKSTSRNTRLRGDDLTVEVVILSAPPLVKLSWLCCFWLTNSVELLVCLTPVTLCSYQNIKTKPSHS